MVLTDDQQRAVTTRNKNLLVAAAAGSGKTKVLVERVKQLILEDEFDVDRLLVVTFTNAAASEMRSRIHAALKEQLNKESNLCEQCHGLGVISLLDEIKVIDYNMPIDKNPIK